jgi:uncharacterized membrane protein YbhN (UPF0104 family)
MKKKIIFFIKLVVMIVILGLVAWQLWKNWKLVEEKHIGVYWTWGLVAVLGFCCTMLTSALVWRWLARKMQARQPNPVPRIRTLPLIAAYTFSQLGKYIPGKVALLLMRLERTKRYGMPARVCTLSTMLENALFMISGGLVGMIAIVRVAGEMDPKYSVLLWPVTAGGMAVLAMGCYPPVFYGIVNRVLIKMKREPVEKTAQLGVGTLVMGVLGFIPCWMFGGLALWASAWAVHRISIVDSWWFIGAYALSVIIGMASLLPGGAGVRDAMLGVAAMLQFQQSGVPHSQAVVYGGVVAVLQRLFQVIAELIMGGFGGLFSRGKKNQTDGGEPSPESRLAVPHHHP